MVPKIHKKRQNFRSTAGYLLHDVAANTNERVAWTATRNLATKDPDLAWRVMAATSMDQDRLKKQAGVPNTGRKSKDHVLHFTLSWHPEEAADLTKAEMIRAANTVLHVMGAERRQALLVAHNDQPQPHVHVMVNRVDPRDGRILSSSFEKLKASRWAEAYEKERGKIYCHERVINNAARKRGEYTRGEKDVPRPVHEAAQATNDNERRKRLLDEHRKRSRLLKEVERRQKARHTAAWEKHEAQQLNRQLRIGQATKQVLAKRLKLVRRDYRPKWAELHHEQLAEQRLFDERETRLLGKVHNALRSIDLRTLVSRREPGDDRKLSTLRGAFQLLADSGARRQAFEREHREAAETLKREQLAHEVRLRRRVADAREAALANERGRAERERNDLVLLQAMERAKLRAQWQAKREGLRRELVELKREKSLQPAQNPRTEPSDLLPAEKRDEAARYVDGWEAIRAKRFGPKSERDREDGRDR